MYRGDFRELNDFIAAHSMIPPGSRVLCAVSGGADSIYLLHRLNHLRWFFDFTLVAAHYNHNLRGEESHRDEQFVRTFVAEHCGAQKIAFSGETKYVPPVELVVGSGDVAAEATLRAEGVEETARRMRYAFLEETAGRLGCDYIATAHTADDNAETLLLNLIRGAGLHGLTGIPPVRGKLIRPLLTTSRDAIEQHLKLFHIRYVEDSTNADTRYRRNKVRHQIIPLLVEMNPRFIPHSADTIAYLRADDAYLQSLADQEAARAVQTGDTITIPAAALGDQPDPIAIRMAARLLNRLDAWQFAAAHLTALVDLCRSEDPSAQADLPHGLTARRVYGDLILEPRREVSALTPMAVDPGVVSDLHMGTWRFHIAPATAPETPCADPRHAYLSPGALTGPLCLRPRQTGDAITLPGRGRRTLKKLFIDAKVPRLHRDLIPILADGAGPLCVPGFGFDAPRLAQSGQPALEVQISFIEKREVKQYAGE